MHGLTSRKSMIIDQVNKLKLTSAAILSMVVVGAIAQSDPTDTPESVKETNIICYAAQKKWVCAPADEKEKAQQKAMKLALSEKDSSPYDNVSSQPVEIQTIEPNNIGQQVQEQAVEDPIQAAIKDFIPREDAVQPSSEQTDEATSTQSAKPAQNIASASASPTKNSAEISQIETKTSPDNNFNQWQASYPEKWTFQVIGTSNRHHLNDFIAQHDLAQNPFSIVRTQANGADWWVVLSGLFDSREQALAQRNQLPTQLSGNAWVRQIKTIVGQAD